MVKFGLKNVHLSLALLLFRREGADMRQPAFHWMIFAGALFVSQAASAGHNYSEPLQVQIQEVLLEDISVRLHSTLGQYNRSIGNQTELISAAKKSGLTDQDLIQISAYTKDPGRLLPKAELKDGEISIQDTGYRIVIGADEFRSRSIRVNERVFQWNLAKSVSENLHQYDSLFTAKNKSESWLNFPAFMDNAWADDLFRIKAAGLRLYFIASAVGEIGGQLDRLNSKVKAMTALCEAPEPPAGQDDPFLKAVTQGGADAEKIQNPILLRNCDDVKNYAKKSVGVMQGVTDEPQGVTTYPRVPVDLCKNIDRLAQCVQQMGPASVTDSAKEKTPTDREEWHEPDQSPKSGTAK